MSNGTNLISAFGRLDRVPKWDMAHLQRVSSSHDGFVVSFVRVVRRQESQDIAHFGRWRCMLVIDMKEALSLSTGARVAT